MKARHIAAAIAVLALSGGALAQVSGSNTGGVSTSAPYNPNSTLAVVKSRLKSPLSPQAASSTTPTITALSDGAIPDIANASFVPVTSSTITVYGAADTSLSYTGALNDGIQRGYYWQASGSAVWCIETVFDGQYLYLNGSQNIIFSLWIDGQPVTGSPFNPTNTNARHLAKIDFGSRAVRHLRIEGNLGGNGFAGFYTGPGDTLSPASNSLVSFGFSGDSYMQRVGTAYPYSDIASAVAQLLNGRVVNTDAIGGTGYFQSNGTNTNLADRFNNVYGAHWGADVYFIAMGLNDSASVTPSQILAGLNAVRSKLPRAILVICGNFQPDPLYSYVSPANKQSTIAVAIKAATAQLSGKWVYIDNLTDTVYTSNGVTISGQGSPWQTGDGMAVNFTGALTAATSGTLTAAWPRNSGSYTISFSDGTTKSVTMTQNNASVSWTGAVTATASACIYKSTPGNSCVYLSNDGTHPTSGVGSVFLAKMLAHRAYQGIMALQ